MAQGKAWNKKDVFEALEPKLKLGYSLTKACSICVIPISTVSTWLEKDEALRLKVNSWQNEISDLARINWSEAIKNGLPTKFGNDTYTPSKEWLERRQKDDFSLRQEHSGPNGEAIEVTIVEDKSLIKE